MDNAIDHGRRLVRVRRRRRNACIDVRGPVRMMLSRWFVPERPRRRCGCYRCSCACDLSELINCRPVVRRRASMVQRIGTGRKGSRSVRLMCEFFDPFHLATMAEVFAHDRSWRRGWSVAIDEHRRLLVPFRAGGGLARSTLLLHRLRLLDCAEIHHPISFFVHLLRLDGDLNRTLSEAS